MDWQQSVSEFLKGVADCILALALASQFTSRGTAPLGVFRWVFVAACGLTGALQIAVFAFLQAGWTTSADTANVLVAVLMLSLASLLWPFLGHVTRRLRRAADGKLAGKLAEAEIAAVEARRWLLLAEEIAHVGHWRIGWPTRDLFWSDEIFRIHGLNRESYVPQIDSAIDAFHPDDRALVRNRIETAVREKTRYELIGRLVRSDGSIRHVLSRGILEQDRYGEVTGIFGVIVDMTAQMLVQEQLKAANVAAAKANQALRALALVDGLTGLPNRRQFDDALAKEFRRARRDQTALGLVMIDVDHFKAFNDLYGHPAGDEALRRVAGAIAAVPQRPGDLAARYGGEELALLLPGTTEQGAEAVAMRAIEAVRKLDIPHAGSALGRLSISCGLAMLHGADVDPEPLMLVRRADVALYAAKRQGRGRVCSHAEASLTAWRGIGGGLIGGAARQYQVLDAESMKVTDESAYFYEPKAGHGLPHDPFNAIVGPRPIGWISTIGTDGSVNLAPYSFFNAFNYKPPIIGFSSITAKDSLRNARDTGMFVWNLVTRDLAAPMNASCAAVPYGTDEFEMAGLTKAESRLVAAPRVAEAGVSFECRVADIVQLKSHAGVPVESWLVLGEVVGVHIARHLLKDGVFDTFGAGILLRAGGPSAYAEIRPESRFDMVRPG